MHIYNGTREGNICRVTVDGVSLDSRPQVLAVPFGEYEWGYNGGGPARLAFAILAHYFGDDGKALGSYRAFCDMVVAELKDDKWSITTEESEAYLKRTVEVPMTLGELLKKARDLGR